MCKQNIHKLSKSLKVVAKLYQNDRKVVPKFSQSSIHCFAPKENVSKEDFVDDKNVLMAFLNTL